MSEAAAAGRRSQRQGDGAAGAGRAPAPSIRAASLRSGSAVLVDAITTTADERRLLPRELERQPRPATAPPTSSGQALCSDPEQAREHPAAGQQQAHGSRPHEVRHGEHGRDHGAQPSTPWHGPQQEQGGRQAHDERDAPWHATAMTSDSRAADQRSGAADAKPVRARGPQRPKSGSRPRLVQGDGPDARRRRRGPSARRRAPDSAPGLRSIGGCSPSRRGAEHGAAPSLVEWRAPTVAASSGLALRASTS